MEVAASMSVNELSEEQIAEARTEDSNQMSPSTKIFASEPPNTDNLLDISVPKVALLGKEQAKKRLYAFSASKQSISPSCKRSKSKCEEKVESDLVKKPKKSMPNPGEKAKAVIEEIEEIKKIEHAYYEAIEQGLLDTKKEWKEHHRKSRRRSRSSNNVRSRSVGRDKYPENWSKIKKKGYDQEKLTDLKSLALKEVDECLDFRKQFLFETPSQLLHPFVYKDTFGKERTVSTLSRRVTKAKPKISFSVTEKVEFAAIFNRNCVLEYVPKQFKENVLKIIGCSSRPLETIPSKPTTRRWYPKTAFSSVEKETECTVLENSLGLSFLQNYTDEEEQDKEDKKWVEKNVNDENEVSRPKKSQDEKKKKQKKKSKIKNSKEKRQKQKRTRKERVEAPERKIPKMEKSFKEDSKSKKNKECSDKEVHNNIVKKDVENVPSKKSHRLEETDTKSKSKRKRHKTPPKLDKVRENKIKTVSEKHHEQLPNKSPIQHTKKQLSPEKESKTTEVVKDATEQELDTPDTDEYYSNWESEDELLNSSTSKRSDLYTDTSGVNLSWESDTDIPLSKSPPRQFYQSQTPDKEVAEYSPFRDRFINERRRSRCSLDNPSPPFLEMPLNIRTYRKVEWQEERDNAERINFRIQSDQKTYSLYTEDSWEKDDYMTIKSEELRLEEERRTLIEERRQLEIEKRKLEELERERYYFRRSNPEGDEQNRHKHYRSHREMELEKGSRRSSLEVAPENTGGEVGDEQKPQALPSKRRKSRWQDIDVNELETSQPTAMDDLSLSNITVEQTEIDIQKPEVLENEYEKFIKALGSETAKEKTPVEKKSRKVVKKRSKPTKSSSSSSSSSSSDDSDSSSTSSATSSSSSSCKKRKKVRRKSTLKKKNKSPIRKVENKQVIKIEDVERDLLKKEPQLEIPLPQLETSEQKTIPLPVPSPKVDMHVLNESISPIASIKIEDLPNEKTDTPKKNNIIPIKFLTPELRKQAHETTLANEIGTISAILSPPLETNLEHQNDSKTDSPLQSVINDFNLSNNMVKNEEEVTTTDCMEAVNCKSNFKEVIDIDELSISKRDLKRKENDLLTTTDCMEAVNCKSNFKEVIDIDELSISKRDLKRKENDLLKRNEEAPNSGDSPTKHNAAYKRKKERKDSEDVSPKSEINRKLSSNQFNHFAINKCTKTEKENLQRISSIEKCTNLPKASPLSSPLDGFKRSVADSTISDDQLLQSNLVECAESPNVYKTVPERSPRRMSLDERINQALGLSEEPKPIATTYSGNCNFVPQYYEECYDGYMEEPKKPQMINKRDNRSVRQNSKLKVLQVGNILQVVPTEDYSKIPAAAKKKTPLQQNKISNSTQKILQVGNMLQIVPTTSFPDEIESADSTPVALPLPSTPVKNTFNAELLIKQKAERRAEKDKRKQERQLKRKEKEKKRKERERRKQLKVKLQTEAMIKQALILEDVNITEEQLNEPQKPAQWPPIPQIISNCTYRPPGKGILCQRREEKEELIEKRKQVQFSDGVRPGEGTSPSGGEELSSPPPAPRKLPKEKRFRKIKPPKKEKVPKKKKVKVKVIRQQSQYDDENEEDNLPPPPPPPGSPPPHIFPARIKEPIFNNIHPNLLGNPPIQTPDTSYPPPVYRPSPPMVIPHHIPLHPPGPPPSVHRHHVPPLPHHGGFSQSTNLIPHGNHR